MSHSPYPFSDAELLRRVTRSPGSKAGYKQLIRELGLGGGRERRLLTEQLTRMVARGVLLQVDDGLWGLPSTTQAEQTSRIYDESTQRRAGDRVSSTNATFSRRESASLASGRLELHRDGFGFVREEKSGPGVKAASVPSDIFIPPNALHGAMHGDLVLVDEDPVGRDGRRSGKVARILTRRNQTVVGVFHYARPRGRITRNSREPSFSDLPQGHYVQPWDERLGGPISIPGDPQLLLTLINSPHRTLGEESAQKRGSLSAETDAKAPFLDERDSRWPMEGLVVEVEITQFAQPGRPAVGRVLEVLGPPDAFGVDVEIVIRKHGLPHTFPAHVLAEAERSAEQTVASLPKQDLSEREDFRGLPIVTIDGETARDFDDAVLVRPMENGNTELQVHIADVSHYVQAGSAVDTEARVRGTSVYFPDRAVPMLPHALSSGMCSLLPREDRLVLSCVMEIDSEGEVVHYRVAEGIIRSVRRLTYTSVQHCLNASPDAVRWNAAGSITPDASVEDQAERERLGLELPELPGAIDRMLTLALRLNAKRVRRGSIDFDLPEPVVEFDPDGNMKAIVRSERGWAHRLIEEFMLSANECVATWLTAQGIPSLYRIHEMPDPKRIVDFEETAAAFGQTLGIGALPVKKLMLKGDRRDAQRRTERGQGRRAAPTHDVPERIPVTPQMYQKLVRRIAGKPEERILSYLMLRSLKQARYSEQNEGHFALASPCYTHFTSPIRRYPDLIVHRLVRAMLQAGASAEGGAVRSTDPQPWKADAGAARTKRSAQVSRPRPFVAEFSAESPKASKRAGRVGWSRPVDAEFPSEPTVRSAESPAAGPEMEPIAATELAAVALESSQAERRAADAERELVEWKKMKFMAERIGDDFTGLILSVTKFGFFVELDELFVEGLVPLSSLAGDFYSFRDGDRAICGARNGHCFRVGDHVSVVLDRIDRQQRRLQFALLPGTEPSGSGSPRRERAEGKGPSAKHSKKTLRAEKKAKTAKRRKRS